MIERTHLALKEFYRGNPLPYKKLFSPQNDISLAGAFGGVSSGLNEVTKHLTTRASFFKGGRSVSFESVAKFSAGELGYTFEVEHFEARVGDTKKTIRVALRATTIFRREDGTWKVVHRIGDPMVSMIDPTTYRSLARHNEQTLD